MRIGSPRRDEEFDQVSSNLTLTFHVPNIATFVVMSKESFGVCDITTLLADRCERINNFLNTHGIPNTTNQLDISSSSFFEGSVYHTPIYLFKYIY